MVPQPVDVLFYTPFDVVLWSVAHFFLDPGDIHVSIRSVSRVTPGLQTDLGIGDRRFHCLDKLAVDHRPLAADVVYSVRQFVSHLEELDGRGAVLDIKSARIVLCIRRSTSHARKIGRHAFRRRVTDSTGRGGQAVVKRPERATDAQRHHLEIRPEGVVQPEDLQRLLECLGGIARVYGQERFFAERTLGEAGIDSYGAGQAHAPDIE